jgi:hypothetical protein
MLYRAYELSNVADPHPNPHHFRNLDPDPHPHQVDKPDPDPHPHQLKVRILIRIKGTK